MEGSKESLSVQTSTVPIKNLDPVPAVEAGSLPSLGEETKVKKTFEPSSTSPLGLSIKLTSGLRTLIALSTALAFSLGLVDPQNMPFHPFSLLMYSQWSLILISWALIGNVKHIAKLAVSLAPQSQATVKKPQLLLGIINFFPVLGPIIAIGMDTSSASVSVWDNASIFVVALSLVHIWNDLSLHSKVFGLRLRSSRWSSRAFKAGRGQV